MATDDPTWLYQAYCEHGALLYVGVAYEMRRRIQQHRATKLWWPDVEHVVAGLYPNRARALRVESGIISGALPVHNIAGKPRLKPGEVEPAPHWQVLSRGGHLLDERHF